jgi:hypothetical protein
LDSRRRLPERQVILYLFLDRVRLFESRVKLTEALLQKDLTVSRPSRTIDAQFLGDLESKPSHEHLRPGRIRHLLINFHIQLDRAKHTRPGGQNGVQDTDVSLGQKVIQ